MMAKPTGSNETNSPVDQMPPKKLEPGNPPTSVKNRQKPKNIGAVVEQVVETAGRRQVVRVVHQDAALDLLVVILHQAAPMNDNGTTWATPNGITIEAFMKPLMPRPVCG